MNICIKKIHPGAKVPQFAHHNDAGVDLFALEETTVNPGERVSVRTGIAMAIPDGYVGLIWDKSSVSHKGGIKTLGGVIDAGYRGEILVGVVNISDQPYVFEKGQKVAQMIIQERVFVTFNEVEDLDESTRGDGGFGSTGK